MLVIIVTLTIAGLGIGAICAVILGWIRNRNALPVWVNQTDRAGSYGGKR